MKILWVHRTAAFSGGAEQYIFDTAALLKSGGHRNVLMAGIDSPWERRFIEPFESVLPVCPESAAHLRPDIVYIHNVDDRRLIRRFASSGIPAVRFFHDHSPFCPRTHKYHPITRVTCTRPMGTHCMMCLGVVKNENGPFGLGFSTAGARDRALEADRMLAGAISGSQYMAELIRAHGFRHDRVRSIPLFALPPIRRPDVERDSHRLVFAGTLVRGKGLDVLLHALKKVDPEISLDVAGDGHQAGLFRNLALSLGIADRVRFHGRVTRDRLDVLCAGSLAMVIPSREPETFCLAGLTAFGTGTPVIGSGVGGMVEWLDDGVTGIVFQPPQDDRALAAAISRLASDPGLADRLGSAGFDRLVRDFTPQKHAESLTGFFMEILEAKPA